MLAHELAHTLQPAGGAQRLVASTAISPQARAAIGRGVAAGTRIARWELPWRKKKEAPAPAPAKPAPAKPAAWPTPVLQGPWTTCGWRAASLGGAGVAVGSVALGTHLGKAAGGASEALGGLLVGDSLMGLNNARKMDNDGARFDDAGMTNMAGRKAKNQGNALAGAAISTAKAGMGTAFVQSGGSAKDFVASTGNAALGTAAGALGIAAGSAQVLQGLWRGGKAVQKLCRLTWGRAKTMLSKRGQDWKSAIVSAEKFKGAVGAMKITLGALGIAAGALLIVSNPIGWGIGIAAAIAGGAYAGAKIAGKLKNTTGPSQGRGSHRPGPQVGGGAGRGDLRARRRDRARGRPGEGLRARRRERGRGGGVRGDARASSPGQVARRDVTARGQGGRQAQLEARVRRPRPQEPEDP